MEYSYPKWFYSKVNDVSEKSLDKGMATIANLDRMISKES
jgi:hypothetical protein